MSHFTVLVHITEEEAQNRDIQQLLSEKLQPYHEYECTGIKDQYVKKIDRTDEKMKDYHSKTVECVYDEDGALVGTKYCDRCKYFWKRSGHGYSSDDVFEVPDGYELRKTKLDEIYTFEGYLRDWCGDSLDGEYSVLEDGRFYVFTNENSKWDWWTVGGRWSGMFLDTNGQKQDIIQKKDWDIAGEASAAITTFAPFFDRFEENADKFEGVVFMSWDECCEQSKTTDGKINYNTARELYHNQEYKNILKSVFSLEGDDEYEWLLHDSKNFYNVSREDFMKARIYNSIGTFAVLDDAGWHEKGSMGWFACVSDEKADWNQIYLDKINSIPDHDYLVLVDCHI
ncbi:hypothetical protein GAP32_351 [Cronobacter phage vB_CsaM_GAP32]|uniref:Uncharacterized protein n=1 Tax=Cronobacter phage vB_CsaM_GAP32 TaxID=1141136 RepID=K4F6B3_9CAUD|nr:hypothetical protein GAP32_351 [Cronobacter phage vB_CsaM_GAP32]AFC21801.1 hypothetical protein GAP32_351 [Cronobacter phage vB_CsaM_GAP32]